MKGLAEVKQIFSINDNKYQRKYQKTKSEENAFESIKKVLLQIKENGSLKENLSTEADEEKSTPRLGNSLFQPFPSKK